MKLNRWVTSSLRTKMLIMFVMLTAIPLIAVGIISYTKSYNTVSQHSIATTELVAEHLKNEMDVLFSDNRKFLDISKNSSVLRFLLIQNETYEEAKDILKTFSLYRDTYRFSNGITNIMLFNQYGKGISEKKGVFQMDGDPFQYGTFKNLLNYPDEILILPPSETDGFNNLDHAVQDSPFIISIVATVKQEITDEVIGFMVINLDATVIENFCNNTKMGDNGFFYVTDSYGQPIIVPDKLKSAGRAAGLTKQQLFAPSGNDIRHFNNRDQLVVYATSDLTGWKIVGEVPLSEVVKDAKQIETLIFVSVVFTIVFTITLYAFISSRLIRPIRFLKNKMRQAASGYLEAKVGNVGHDEIADLGISFNTMLDKIKILIENSIKEQEQIKMAELRTLQAQINPHFLYNTLDSIIWLAESKKSEEVIGIVNALATFFRISLSKGKDCITIREEIDHISNYLTIQQMRYRDILDYEIHIQEEILACDILKMTLQPLVENALYHGIKNKRGKGRIRIDGGYGKSGNIEFHVTDNGAGIPKDKQEQLIAMLQQDSHQAQPQSGGFGIMNVHERIRLYYGEPYGLKLESDQGVGTTVIVSIPVRREYDEKSVVGG
ncbi:sensor histidine kinase [Paenibacillus sp. Soil787]|uniref:sensor histidine kinase n=1 Tax=Paenibacillus sp. Soil787 TaxID=1736411 RepID=UPI0006FB5C3B|nr:sensor histidine kinase [Paenibacillus sp. Soil787]KRF42179.1 histidine kinase [Paenibacillus sp. Soil787]